MNTTSSSLLPTDSIALTNDLSLIPRLRLLLTFFRADLAVKPVDEWQLKTALLSFLHSPPISLPSSPSSSDDDIIVLRRLPDLHKLRRGDPVASGCLVIRDISSLLKLSDEQEIGKNEEELARKKYLQWRKDVVEKLEGIELNLEGVKFKMSVEVPLGDDFERMKKEWEDFYAAKLINGRRSTIQRPDTIIVGGVPSRWFAEPRVSSKASLLVTHTIFSVLGKIRNLNVANDDETGIEADETKKELVAGLNCKVWVQYESYGDFLYAMKVLCGRSLQKQGSRLKVDYDVTWDRDGFFRNAQQKPARGNIQERLGMRHGRKESNRDETHVSRIEYDSANRKRFRD